MRRALRWLIVGSFLLATRAAAQTPNTPDQVLFSVSKGEGDTLGLAIVWRSGAFDAALVSVQDEDSIPPRALRPGRTYVVRFPGRPADRLRVVGAYVDGGCSLLWYGHARLTSGAQLPRGSSGLAGNIPGIVSPRGAARALNVAEISMLRRSARAFLAKKTGRDLTRARDSLVAQAAYVTERHDTVIAATWMFEDSTTQAAGAQDDDSEVRYTALTLFEGAPGRWKAGIIWGQAVPEVERQIREVLGLVDLDNDGFPELVTENSYYESYDYARYGRRNGVWIELGRGGGGGC